MKRIMSAFAAVLLLVSMLSTVSFAEETYYGGELEPAYCVAEAPAKKAPADKTRVAATEQAKKIAEKDKVVSQ